MCNVELVNWESSSQSFVPLSVRLVGSRASGCADDSDEGAGAEGGGGKGGKGKKGKKGSKKGGKKGAGGGGGKDDAGPRHDPLVVNPNRLECFAKLDCDTQFANLPSR